MTGRPLQFMVTALWLGNLVPALDATLVGTALPTVIGNLSGLSLYSWVFTTNLLAMTTAIPIFGKLADMFGRKPVYFFGMAVYSFAAVMSVFVQTVEQLIVCRALAGLGIAAVAPIAMTIMGDALSVAQRAKLQWVFASAWFGSSLVGPLVSSFVVLNLSWRFTFLITLPFALASCTLLAREYHETVQRQVHRIDYLGVVLLGAGVLALLIGLSPGSKGGINFASSGGLLSLAVVLLSAFVWNETRAAEPILPPKLLLGGVIGIAALGSFASGAVQFGASSFVPLFVQGAQGGTAAIAGAVLAPLTLGWPIGAGLGGRFLLRLGYRRAIIGGMSLAIVAQGGFLLLNRESHYLLASASMALLGLGFGFSNVGMTLAVQNSVGWGQRGVATAALQFFRSIGGSIGVGVMGTILTLQMQPALAAVGDAASASALLDPTARSALTHETLLALQTAMGGGLHIVFIVMFVCALAAFALVWRFPQLVIEQPEAAAQPRSSDLAQARS